ncbi:MAG: thermonuclease family protein, partial [Bradyrhizobium sp.]
MAFILPDTPATVRTANTGLLSRRRPRSPVIPNFGSESAPRRPGGPSISARTYRNVSRRFRGRNPARRDGCNNSFAQQNQIEATVNMRFLILILAVLSASQSWAAGAVVKDGGTLQLAGVTYRLDGIDAPELDQMCIDEHADTWACGLEARDQLAKLSGGREIRCGDLGADPAYKKRRIGVCTVVGETTSLNQLLVRQGFALNFDPAAKGRFREDEAGAKDRHQGLWKGCFVAPSEFRRGRKDGAVLGESCRTDKDREIRA